MKFSTKFHILNVLIMVICGLVLLAVSPAFAQAPSAPGVLSPAYQATTPPIAPAPANSDLMTLFASGAGIALSLAFRFIPKFNDWYQTQTSANKSYIMLGSLAVVALIVFGISCAGYSGQLNLPQLVCTPTGAIDLLKLFVTAAVVNQATYMITPAKAPPTTA